MQPGTEKPCIHRILCSPPASPDSEVGREFLQERLALFAKVLFLINVAFYVVANAIHQVWHPGEAFHFIGCHHNQYHLAVAAVVGAVWFVSSRRQPGPVILRALDLGGTFLACAGYALVSWASCGIPTDYTALLGTTNTLATRAILVPSTPRQTLLLGALSSIPTVLATLAIRQQTGSTVDPSMPPSVNAFYAALWCATAVVVSTVSSRVIYGLRREVREARRLGQYTLEERIGGGGMGEVYRARHELLRRPTAVKVLRKEFSGERGIARFEREVQLTSQLTHPNTVAIYDYGRTPDGQFYYAMEYLPGITLDQLVREHGAVPAGRTIHILRQVCASLGEAHGVGLIHRDIKGANVILCERGGVPDIAKLVDFGLVKDIERLDHVTLSAEHMITGTPLYLSPEAIRTPDRVDARTDIYAVGVLGYFLVTGKNVFDGENFVEICSHHLHTPPTPPSERGSAPVPKDLEEIILACLAKSPADRPRDVDLLRRRLDACGAAGTWTEADAAAWWRAHGKGALAHGSSAPPTADVAVAPTVVAPGVPSRAVETI